MLKGEVVFKCGEDLIVRPFAGQTVLEGQPEVVLLTVDEYADRHLIDLAEGTTEVGYTHHDVLWPAHGASVSSVPHEADGACYAEGGRQRCVTANSTALRAHPPRLCEMPGEAHGRCQAGRHLGT